MNGRILHGAVLPVLIAALSGCKSAEVLEGRRVAIREINPPAEPERGHAVAILGATLIDGRGGEPVTDSVVLVLGSLIKSVGKRGAVKIPEGARIIEAGGLFLLPGLIDAHFHIGAPTRNEKPVKFLSEGVTSLRDPGQWIRRYDSVIRAGDPIPRCFLTGPHLDQGPPAYPKNSILIPDARAAREAVGRFVNRGASAIKVYYRLPLDLVRATCEAAHARAVPVTAHLELLDAGDAILAGLDGVEHVTSFGTALAEPDVAEAFRRRVRADNAERKRARFDLWSTLDLERSDRARGLIDLMKRRKITLTPTLAPFDAARRRFLRGADERLRRTLTRGYENMQLFVRMCRDAGISIACSSHAPTYHRETVLLVEAGLTPMEVIVAATSANAAFFRIEERLGTVEPGKLADLILVEANPLEDVANLKKIRKVMLNGVWTRSPDIHR